jgi:hypothetical protein
MRENSRDQNAGKAWGADFAQRARKVGRGLSRTTQEGALAKREHGEWFDLNHLSTLAQAYSTLAALAGADEVAAALSLDDLAVSNKRAGPMRARADLLDALDRSLHAQDPGSAQQALWIARARGRLQEKFPDIAPARLDAGLAQLLRSTHQFNQETDDVMRRQFGSDQKELTWSKNTTYAEPVADEGQEVLLGWRHDPNMDAHLLLGLSRERLMLDELDQPEGRFVALRAVYAYDHPALLRKFPHGACDGIELFLPARMIGAAFGSDGALDRATATLRSAAAAVLGTRERSTEDPALLAPGALADELEALGLSEALDALRGEAWKKELATRGIEASDVAAGLDACCWGGWSAWEADDLDEPFVDKRSDERRATEILRLALWSKNDAWAEQALSGGADPRAKTARGVDALMIAASKDRLDWVERLAPTSGLTETDEEGAGALVYAAQSGAGACVHWLAERLPLTHLARQASKAAGACGEHSELGTWIQQRALSRAQEHVLRSMGAPPAAPSKPRARL